MQPPIPCSEHMLMGVARARRYCAPEVLALALAGAPTVVRKAAQDMWSVGVVMFEMYTGHGIFPDNMKEEDMKAALTDVRAPSPRLVP